MGHKASAMSTGLLSRSWPFKDSELVIRSATKMGRKGLLCQSLPCFYNKTPAEAGQVLEQRGQLGSKFQLLQGTNVMAPAP